MSDTTPVQLPLFTSHIDYALHLTGGGQIQDWPLPSASTLEEAVDAAKGLGVFLMFHQGVLWDDSFDNPEAFIFTGIDLVGDPVRLEVTMEDAYIDSEGNKL